VTEETYWRGTPLRTATSESCLEKWGLTNFKSIKNQTVDFAPLTVVVGHNSAGKSSLLQSILVMAAAAGGTDPSISLNPGPVRLGTVHETAYKGPGAEWGSPMVLEGWYRIGLDGREEVEVFFDTELPEGLEPEGFERDFLVHHAVTLGTDADAGSGRAAVEAVTFRLFRGGDDPSSSEPVAAIDLQSNPSQGRATYSGIRIVAGEPPQTIVDARLSAGLPIGVRVETPLAPILFDAWKELNYFRRDSELDTFLALNLRAAERSAIGDEPPALDERDLDNVAREAINQIQAAIESGGTRPLQSIRASLLANDNGESGERPAIPWAILNSEELYERVLAGLDQAATTSVWLRGYEDHLTRAVSAVQRFLRREVRYLGPLRVDPHFVAADSPDPQSGQIGPRGEYLAATLLYSGNRLVRVPLPEEDRTTPLGDSRVTFSRALALWARHFGILDTIKAAEAGRFGPELQLTDKDVDLELDLTKVGTGVSQLLPVIAVCLLAGRGSLTLIEQPELHLNPAVQQKLADFFLTMAGSGRRLVVETHSEYLVSRLRLAIVSDETDLTKQAIGLVFAKREHGQSAFETVETDEFGSLQNWPEGFFDQSVDDARNIVQAAVRKRRSRTEFPEGPFKLD